ncbi:hypothetical protein F4820DRAFT_428419, partial [Hypoxylon rubiginosum]
MSRYLFSKEYLTLPQDELSPPNLDQQAKQRRKRTRSRWTVGFFASTTVIFAVLSVWLGSQLHAARSPGTFETGFRTELGPAKRLIKLEERLFTGSPAFLDDGTEYVPPPPDGIPRPKYVGEPSREIDHNWALLHWGRFFLLTDDEARDAWGPRYKEFWAPKQGGYVAALESFHTVHCLDHIRKAFYPDAYPTDSPIHGALHRDHCINHLRQTVMCNLDLTPIPSRFWTGIDNNYIDGDRMHTCRNWQKVRDWVTERYNGSLAVPPAEGTEKLNSEF